MKIREISHELATLPPDTASRRSSFTRNAIVLLRALTSSGSRTARHSVNPPILRTEVSKHRGNYDTDSWRGTVQGERIDLSMERPESVAALENAKALRCNKSRGVYAIACVSMRKRSRRGTCSHIGRRQDGVASKKVVHHLRPLTFVRVNDLTSNMTVGRHSNDCIRELARSEQARVVSRSRPPNLER